MAFQPKLHPELLTRTALDGVVQILQRPNPAKLPEGLSDVTMVLFDQITELWPLVQISEKLANEILMRSKNEEQFETERAYHMRTPLHVAEMQRCYVEHGTLFHRWMVIDAVRSAELCAPSTLAQPVIELVKIWVLRPTKESREAIAKVAPEQAGSPTMIATSNAAHAVTMLYPDGVKTILSNNAYLATHNRGAEEAARKRVGLLYSLRNLLPEPVPSVFQIEREGLDYPDDLYW